MTSQENRELIKEHLEGMQGLESLSVKSFLEHGKVSGSLLKRLESMLNHKEERVKRRLFRKFIDERE